MKAVGVVQTAVGVADVQGLLESALADPWATMGLFVDGPLHPGGKAATERLFERAGVEAGTRLLDVGCGGGEALTLARQRGADAVGLDTRPRTDDILQGAATRLPLQTDAFDVVVAECVLCLADEYPAALSETRRVLDSGGRLAFSDVVVEGRLPDVPETMAEMLCLTGNRDPETVLGEMEAVGFRLREVYSHREELLAMRDELAAKVDYEGLLGVLGETGQRALDGIQTLETELDEGRIDYVSVVADVE